MKKILSILAIALLLGSCSNFLEEYSQDLSQVETYTDLDEVLLGDGYLPVGRVDVVNSNYVMEDDYFQCVHYMSDELIKYITNNEGDHHDIQETMFGYHTWQQVVGRNFQGNTTYAEDVSWNQAYHGINACNMVLDAIDEQRAESNEEELEKTRIKGEAAFLRALYYFELVNLYGKPYCEANRLEPGVPLKLTPVVEDKDYVCNTLEEVYEQIIKDLDLADTCLVGTVVKNHPYRADITAVYLLKSRVYLYMQDWENALIYVQKALEKNNRLLDLHSFVASDEVLGKASPETIFSMGGYIVASAIHDTRSWTSWGTYDNLPVYTISNDLVEVFEKEGRNDLRAQYYICRDTVGGGWGYAPYVERWTYRKIKGWETGYKEVSDIFLFRTAEAYLNGAEAAAMAGDEATARSLLKTLRDNRLVNSDAIAEAGSDLVTLIREERQKELCLEGHRWFDLRRYTVNEQYPYSKKIVHYYTEYTDSYGEEAARTIAYTLEENDPAYTLALPEEVLDFQNSLGSNFRPSRAGADYVPSYDMEVGSPEEPKTEEYWEGYYMAYEEGLEAGAIDVENPGSFEGYWAYYNNPFDEYDEPDQFQGYEDGFEAGYREVNPTEDYIQGHTEGYEAGLAAGASDAADGTSNAYNSRVNPYDATWDRDLYDGWEDGFMEGYNEANPGIASNTLMTKTKQRQH